MTYVLPPITHAQCLTYGLHYDRVLTYTYFSYKELSVSDRWRSWPDGLDMYILSPIQIPSLIIITRTNNDSRLWLVSWTTTSTVKVYDTICKVTDMKVIINDSRIYEILLAQGTALKKQLEDAVYYQFWRDSDSVSNINCFISSTPSPVSPRNKKMSILLFTNIDGRTRFINKMPALS